MNYHKEIFSKEILENIVRNENGNYIDATCGDGGHTLAILSKLKTGFVLAVDIDAKAIEIAKKRLDKFSDRLILINGSYENLDLYCEKLNLKNIEGIIFDLGLRTSQIESERFSFRYGNAILDFRLSDDIDKQTAIGLLNFSSEKELITIFKEFGGIKDSKKLVKEILKYRNSKQIITHSDLNYIINKAFPYVNSDLIVQIYQAIRIAVNNELEVLKRGLFSAYKVLKVGGKMAVITFHSAEDRIVKTFFKSKKNFIYQDKLCWEVIKPFPFKPTEEEISKNPRARSAKLRIAQKVN